MLSQQRARRIFLVAEPAREHVHDRDARVEADQVGKRQRPKRMAEARASRPCRSPRRRRLRPEASQTASLMNGIRIRLETNPGRRAPRPAPCRARGRARGSPRPSRPMSPRARITSTSLSTGTGLKKCMPITRSGPRGHVGKRRDRDRARVRGEDRRARRRRRSAARKTASFALDLLADRLDHQIGVDELVDRRSRERARRLDPGRPSPRASRGSGASSQALARVPREAGRSSETVVRTPPRPVRCRRPSGPRRRRARAGTPSATSLLFRTCRSGSQSARTPRQSSGSGSAAGRPPTGTSSRPTSSTSCRLDWSRWQRQIDTPPIGWTIFVAEIEERRRRLRGGRAEP